ncbi:MAG: cytochrome ubiquinol oxidase subunit I [Vicinamibacterales bacterium]|nr:cytochrome ubiquinol oxidase subunit I [Vicinamibacterales bacterium]
MDDIVLLARWQFAITCVYHFFFVPLTLGLVWVVAGMHTAWHITGKDVWLRLTRFWGKLFLINFAMGLVTGIVMEFQFGMNWSEYSRFVGDIFGAPLAIEALFAFFLESTFLGLWIFGWDKLPKKVHLACIWVVAVGSNLSAFWILIANSFMHQPVGYVIANGRAEMNDFAALVFNPHVFVQFPHVITGAMAMAGFFVLGISAWHLRRSTDDVNRDAFTRSFRIGAVYALVASLAVALVGHSQAQYMIKIQPMKMAAAEALWENADPAPLSLFTWGNEPEKRDVWAIKAPGLLSFLAYNRFSGEVKGIRELQAEAEQRYGPGDYVPPVKWTYWTFRAMVGAGTVMLLLGAWAVYASRRTAPVPRSLLLTLLVPAISLPYIAHSTGWIFTEIGRSPWIVYGLQKISDGVSPAVTAGELWVTLVGFTLLYGVLMVADVYLLAKYARGGVTNVALHGGEALAEPVRA